MTPEGIQQWIFSFSIYILSLRRMKGVLSERRGISRIPNRFYVKKPEIPSRSPSNWSPMTSHHRLSMATSRMGTAKAYEGTSPGRPMICGYGTNTVDNQTAAPHLGGCWTVISAAGFSGEIGACPWTS